MEKIAYDNSVENNFNELMRASVFDDNAVAFFRFDPIEIKNIHRNLYKDVTKSGSYSLGVVYNFFIEKNEFLNENKTFPLLIDIFFNGLYTIQYDKLSREEVIDKIAHFITDIYRVHPFVFGNTKTIAIFTKRFLELQGFDIDVDKFISEIDTFKEGLQLAKESYDKQEIELVKYDALKMFLSNVMSDSRHYNNLSQNMNK